MIFTQRFMKLRWTIYSFCRVSGSVTGREDFLKQLQNTHDGMKDTCLKVEKKLQSEKAGGRSKFYKVESS